MLSFSPWNVAVRKLCLSFSISLNFRLLHLLQVSQQSWVQLESPFMLPSEAMEKRNSSFLFEEDVLSLWSKRDFILKRKRICSGEIRNVWEANFSLSPFLKITEPTAGLWVRANQPNFQEKYYLCKEKALLAPLFFHRKPLYFLMLFPALSAWWHEHASSRKWVDFLTFKVIPLISSKFPIFWALSQDHVEETMSIPLSRDIFLERMQKREVRWFYFSNNWAFQ